MKEKRRPLLVALTLGVAALVLIAAGAILASRNGSSSQADGTIPEREEAKVVLSGFVDVEGGILSLYPLQPGRVVQILAKENQEVAQSKPLLRLDDRPAYQKWQEADADLKAAQAKYDMAPLLYKNLLAQQQEAIEATRKKLSAANHKLNRARDLLNMKLMSQEEYNAAVDQLKELEAADRAENKKLEGLKIKQKLELTLAAASLDSKKAQLDQARFALDERTLRAPAQGTVLRINVGVGDVLGPNPTEAAILFAVKKPLLIRFNVEQEFAGQVQPGFPAEVQDYVNPVLGSRQGKVTRVAEVFMHTRTLLPQRLSLSMDESRTMEGLVTLEPGQPKLRLGQRVRIIIRPKR